LYGIHFKQYHLSAITLLVSELAASRELLFGELDEGGSV
jgi:hypothetical protein